MIQSPNVGKHTNKDKAQDEEIFSLKQKVKDAKQQLYDEELAFQTEIKRIKAKSEGNVSQQLTKRTKQKEMEEDIKSKMEEEMYKQLQDDQAKIYAELKEKMEKELKSSKKQIQDKIRTARENEKNSQDFIKENEEMIKNFARIIQAEDNETLKEEIESLHKQAEKEIEETIGLIRSEIESKVNIHKQRLENEVKEKFMQERDAIKIQYLK